MAYKAVSHHQKWYIVRTREGIFMENPHYQFDLVHFYFHQREFSLSRIRTNELHVTVVVFHYCYCFGNIKTNLYRISRKLFPNDLQILELLKIK